MPTPINDAPAAARQCMSAGRYEQAVALLQRVVVIQPSADAFVDLAHALRFAHRFDEAMSAYRQSLTLNPTHLPARAGVADLHRQAGNNRQAIAEYHAVLQLNPNLAEVHNNLGMALSAERSIDDAITCYSRAIELKPDLVNAHYNLANAFRSREQLDPAIAAYRNALKLRPDFTEAYNNLGDALEARGDIAQAIAAYDASIRLNPDQIEPRWNRALALLMNGDYERGWAEYEWRLKKPSAQAHPHGPRWDGGDLAGKTILIHAEQGLGDTIQFVRFVPRVAKRGGRVILEVQPSLQRLLSATPGVTKIISSGEQRPAHDVQCPLMSLPLRLGTRLADLPGWVSYVTAEPLLVADWRERLGALSGHRRIGLAWAGNPDHQFDHNRSMHLSDLAPLASLQGVEFHSLQIGSAADQSREATSAFQLANHSPLLNNFAETAALIEHCDAVIAVDTAVAHLAAAMGKPVYLLLAYSPDWRWMRDREDSAWYPTVRIFRQPKPRDWTVVVRSVVEWISGGR